MFQLSQSLLKYMERFLLVATEFLACVCMSKAGGDDLLSLWGGFWSSVLATLSASAGTVLGLLLSWKISLKWQCSASPWRERGVSPDGSGLVH